MNRFIGHMFTAGSGTMTKEKTDMHVPLQDVTKWRNEQETYIIHANEELPAQQQIISGDKYDPTENGESRYDIVFDGDIYNASELRAELIEQGFTFQTTQDSEVIIALYVHRKEKALEDIRGTFSFVLLNTEHGELFGARDRFGVKPFYYVEHDTGIYFASEMKALRESMDRKELDREAFHHYFSFQYVPEPATIFSHIFTLEPGHYFCKKLGENMHTYPYWVPTFNPSNQSIEEKKEKIRDTLRDSVYRHMQSDQSVGAFLSGGVDSSAIVALAKELNPNIQTFTVGFEREGYSEINVAKETAEQLDVNNIHYVIHPEDFVGYLRTIIFQLDEPMADPAAIPLYFATRKAKQYVDVVLSGEGADELFGGYTIYREPFDLQLFDRIPRLMKTMLRKVANIIPEGVRGKSFIERGTTDLADRFIGNSKIFSEKEKASLLQNYSSEFHFTNVTKPMYDEVSNKHKVLQMQYIDLHTWLRGDILVKADRMPMAHGLNLRVPFLDKEVFNVASELHPSETITNNTTKYALREAMRGIVPDSVLYNRKLGFPVPIRHWLRKELYEWAKETIQNSETEDLIYKPYVLDMLEAHREGKRDFSRKLWTVICFMIWYELYIEY